MLLSLDNLVLYLDTIYSYLMKPTIQLLFRLYYRRSIRGKLEHANQDILFYSASFLAKQIRDKQIKSEFVVKSYIARIKQIQPVLNCVVDERFEQAIQEARELDARIERGELEPSEKSHPLLGVPFTCKELIEVRGLNWSCGLVARKHVKADEDAPVVTQMRAAGAIPVCVTITSELGLWFESSNHVYGQCRNPYDTTRMVGGSSGGEGCLIAAQGSVIGIGSDIAGSLRIPAVFNGIFSHKPTNGLIKNVGVYPYVKNYEDFMLTMGPMCRYSEDLEPVLDVLLDDEAKSKLVNFDSFDLKKTKFYYISHLDAPFVSKMAPEVRLAHVNFIKYIEEKFGGAKVERIDPGKYFGRAFEIWFKMITDGKSDQVSTLISTVEVKDENNNNAIKKKNPIVELLKSVVGMSEHTLPTLALGLLEKLPMNSDGQTPEEFEAEVSVLRDEFARLLGQESVLIFPSFPSAAPYHNQALLTNPLDWAVYFGYVNSIGLPSTQLPLGLAKSDDGLLPVGVQLISNRFCDRLTIRLAQLFEKDLGGWIEP